MRFVHTDVTDEAAVRRAVDAALEAFGAVHGLVNAAGIPAVERVLPQSALVAHIFANEMLNGEVIRLDGAIRMAPR